MASIAPVLLFDIAGPIIVQSVARHHGASQTAALALAGAPPAAWIVVLGAQRRRLDGIGLFVLSSIVLATVIGLVTGRAKLYLLDGAFLTGAFGVICLASLLTDRPLMYRFALESRGGPDTPQGEQFDSLWQYESFRHTFHVMTVVWGVGFVAQAAINIAIIEATSTSRAFVINKILPYVFLAGLGAWTAVYGIRAKRRGERMRARYGQGEPAEPRQAPVSPD